MTPRTCIQLLLTLCMCSTVLAMDHPSQQPLIQNDVPSHVNEDSDKEWFEWIKIVHTFKAADGTTFNMIKNPNENLVMFGIHGDPTGLHFTIDRIGQTFVEFHATIRVSGGQEYHIGYIYTINQQNLHQFGFTEWEKQGLIKSRDHKGDPIKKPEHKIDADRNKLRIAARWNDLFTVPKKFGEAVMKKMQEQHKTNAMIKAGNETGYHSNFTN